MFIIGSFLIILFFTFLYFHNSWHTDCNEHGYLYDKLNPMCILIGFYLWPVEDNYMDDLTIKKLLCYHIKQVDSMLPWVWTVIHCRRHQNVVRTSVTNWAQPLFCSYHFWHYLWSINHLTPKSDWQLISPGCITLESKIKVTRIKELIT